MTMLPADDRGFLLGDGLFETVLAVDGRLDMFEAHAGRMARGCDALGLPKPETAQLMDAAQRALDTADLAATRAAVRLTWTAGAGGRGLERPKRLTPRLIASAAPAPEVAAPMSLLTVGVRRNDGSPATRLKTLAYLDNVLARREALGGGADEALMLNTRGEIACAAAANVFWLAGSELQTPALTCGVLDGIMRGRIIQAAQDLGLLVREVVAPHATLARAQAVFLTNSLIGVRPVSRLDGRPLSESEWVRRLGASVSV